jgi:isopenicillin-N N-acyltransferase like protein
MMLRFCILFLLYLPFSLQAHNLRTEGSASLTEKEGSLILFVEGTPYERGYQHGVLLKDLIHKNIAHFIDNTSAKQHPRTVLFNEKLPFILPFIPATILEELKGLSEGSSVPLQKILLLNLFPEMFHCSAIAVQGDATADKKLYHVRALDYNIGKNLQHTAVLIVAKPSNAFAYISVSYAGFVGSITGMNEKKIAIGEIGGAGYGHWEGLPMAFLIKEALEKTSSLEEAKQLFSSTPRTCEYYYLISDGNQDKAVGIYATPNQIHFIESGSNYALLAPSSNPKDYKDTGLNDKFVISPCKILSSNYQTVLYDNSNNLIALLHHQPRDSIVLTGFAHPARYPHLIDGINSHFGSISHLTLQNLLNDKTTLSSNLHNAIFLPSELKMWVSHAGKEGEPAYTQGYTCFEMTTLLKSSSFY